MTTTRFEPSTPGLTPVQWLICAMAAIGFAFDSYELLMAPLVIPPALSELLKAPVGSPIVNSWAGFLLYAYLGPVLSRYVAAIEQLSRYLDQYAAA